MIGAKKKDKYQESDSLKKIIANQKFVLDCGHHVTLNHNLGNNVVIINGTELKVVCTLCYD